MLVPAILVLLIVLPLVNAIFDPIEYNKGSKLYRIDTPILGMNIADIQLIENTDQCLTDCYAILRIHPYKQLKTSDKSKYNWNWKNSLTNKVNYIDYNFYVKKDKIKSWEDKVCSKYINELTKNGSISKCSEYKTIIKNKTIETWEKIDFYNYNFPIDKDTYIKIEGKKVPKQNLEWIPTFYGYKLDKWAWWNGSWNKKMQINITTSVTKTNQAFKITLNTSNFNYSHALSNLADLRVLNSSEDGELDFWVEHYNSSGESYVWVELPSFTNTSIYLYYNNSGASNSSSMANTFAIFSDDFEDNDITDWTQGAMDTLQITSSIVKEGSYSLEFEDANWGVAYAPTFTNQTEDFIVEFDIYYNASGSSREIIGVCADAYANDNGIYSMHNYNGTGDDPDDLSYYDGAYHQIPPDEGYSGLTWYEFKTRLEDAGGGDSQWDFWRNGVLQGSNFGSRGTISQDSIIKVYLQSYGSKLTRIDNVFVYSDYGTPSFAFGSEENTSTTISANILNVTESSYKASDLMPDIWAWSNADFNVTLNLSNDVNGSIYNILTHSETANTNYTNTSIIIDTTNYPDNNYTLNLTADAGGGLFTHIGTNVFKIDNLRINYLNNITCDNIYKENELTPTVSIYSTENFTANLFLKQGSDTWSLNNFTYAGGGNYTNSFSINTSQYSDSNNYYLYLNVTDNINNVDSNTSCNFSLDNTAPSISLNWNINNNWYKTLNHTVYFNVIDSMTLNITCNVTYNAENWYQNFTNNTQYNLSANLTDGTNNFYAICWDAPNNSNSINESILMSYTKINVKDEETRDDFPISNYSASMFVTPAGNSSLTYEQTNSSKMLNWYFYTLNDTIKTVRLAIGTTYYRSQTDLQNLNNITFYMYNASNYSSSQILFVIDTAGYEKPILIKRPRGTSEDVITAEYPVGTNQEVNAYLLDSRVYNIYGYDSNNDLILIDTLMVAGARTIHLTIPDVSNRFVSVNELSADLWAEETATDNYTIYGKGIDDGGGNFNIKLYNSTDDLLSSGAFTGTGTLTYNVGNISLLNNTYFYALFEFEDSTLKRSIIISDGGLTLPDFGAWNIGTDGKVGIAIFVIFLILGIAGAMVYYVGEIGLIVGGAIGIIMSAFFGLTSYLYLFGLLLIIIGGAVLVLKR